MKTGNLLWLEPPGISDMATSLTRQEQDQEQEHEQVLGRVEEVFLPKYW